MIRYIKRHDLDVNKYDNCINYAVNSRIYAYSWYLDIVADNWDALVLNDYEAVMPLPWRSKYFIKYVYPPVWTQQLGVFSKYKIESNLIKEFISSIPKKFKKITIQFNSENDLSLFKIEKRVNYVLNLNKAYSDIFLNFRKGRKSSIKQGLKVGNIIKEVPIDELIKIGKSDYSYLKISNKSFLMLRQLANFINNNNGFVLGVYTKSNQFLGGSLFLKDKKRIIYLFSVATKLGKQNNAISLIVDNVISDNQNSEYVLDFEGSMIENISSFYKSFGVAEENYFMFKDCVFC